MSENWRRAWQDTKSNLGWLETVLGGTLTGAISYGVLSYLASEGAAMEEVIAICIGIFTAGFLIPSGKLMWNRIQAPARRANDKISDLQKQIDIYKAIEGIQEVKIVDREINGRWYGKKFVLDNPKHQFNAELRDLCDGGKLFYIECPPHALVHIEIVASEISKVHFSRPEADSQIIEGMGGNLEVTVDRNSNINVWAEWGTGELSVYLLAWTRCLVPECGALGLA